jgi:hypothetical protein
MTSVWPGPDTDPAIVDRRIGKGAAQVGDNGLARTSVPARMSDQTTGSSAQRPKTDASEPTISPTVA